MSSPDSHQHEGKSDQPLVATLPHDELIGTLHHEKVERPEQEPLLQVQIVGDNPAVQSWAAAEAEPYRRMTQ
jgi:hypothetical protein